MAEFSPVIGRFSQWKDGVESKVIVLKRMLESKNSQQSEYGRFQLSYINVESCANSLLDRMIFDVSNVNKNASEEYYREDVKSCQEKVNDFSSISNEYMLPQQAYAQFVKPIAAVVGFVASVLGITEVARGYINSEDVERRKELTLKLQSLRLRKFDELKSNLIALPADSTLMMEKWTSLNNLLYPNSMDFAGYHVVAKDGKPVGKIADIVINGSDPEAQTVVVTVGGFLGIGSKPVAVDAKLLTKFLVVSGGPDRLQVDLSREQIGALPEYRSNDEDYSILKGNKG